MMLVAEVAAQTGSTLTVQVPMKEMVVVAAVVEVVAGLAAEALTVLFLPFLVGCCDSWWGSLLHFSSAACWSFCSSHHHYHHRHKPISTVTHCSIDNDQDH